MEGESCVCESLARAREGVMEGVRGRVGGEVVMGGQGDDNSAYICN